MSKTDVVNKIIGNGAVAVIRLKDGSKFNKIAEAIYAGGVASIELTMTTPNAFKLLEEASKIFSDKMMLGMGSVLNAEDAQRAIDSGAKYIVSPIFKKEVLQTSHKNNTAVIPGCLTPTEIQTAYEEGADIIKVFPADVVGMAFFKAVKAPLLHLKLMPTGGVSLMNAGEWLKAGACAVGIGSALLNQKAIDENNFSVLTENAKILMQSIISARS
ncbi:MAG TPA: bifunctional 4-hydroxy-2-oxoglutarate aldolase/2-dehydro-3-deoxy-phosphogluconate aldolase [Ignavibacteriaceae bacterium]|nr:bifunctional 4-hydroxy-2-oxoglutarate aldolase/2-dehydro-3-deoxy-phosphogluconate aldolase [Ignavibacteriaceae bacterium]